MGLAADRLCRGKKSIVVDVKRKEGVALVKRMANAADVLIEPYRPGKTTPLCRCGDTGVKDPSTREHAPDDLSA